MRVLLNFKLSNTGAGLSERFVINQSKTGQGKKERIATG